VSVNPPFPSNYSILVAGPPGVGKLEYFLGLTKGFLEAGERVIFVTLDLHPDEVRVRAASSGLDLVPSEGTSIAFVDCYSSSASERLEPPSSKRVYPVSSFSNLEGIGMAISRAAHDLKPPVRVLFYTVSTLFLHNSPQAIAKFIQIITSRVKTNIGFIAYAMQDGVHDAHTTALLGSLVDGVIEIRFTDDLAREVRAHHMRGFAVSPTWTRFADASRVFDAARGGGFRG
jgi:KaiC/GvpD/RAD55 family RecA-like ATPase